MQVLPGDAELADLCNRAAYRADEVGGVVLDRPASR